MRRFEIYLAKLPSNNGHSQSGTRPVVVISNDAANTYSPLVSVIPLTTRNKKPLPTHVALTATGLHKPSTALCENVMPLDKQFMIKRIGYVWDTADRAKLERAVAVQLGLAAA